MKKLKLFFACLLMAVLSIGQVWGAVYFEDTFSNVGTGSSGNILPRDGWSGSGTTAPQNNTGVRLGASGSGATLTKGAMSNIEGEKTLKVTIYVARYNTNANTLTVTATDGTIESVTLADNVSTGSGLSDGTLTIKPSANAGVTSTTAAATWADAYKTEFTITGASSSTTIAFASDKRLILGPVKIEDAAAGDEPTIGANPSSVAFGTKNIYDVASQTGSIDVAVSGSNLTGNITAALSGDDASMFSISGAPFVPEEGSASGTLTVSYEVTEIGDYSASLTLSSEGADNVVLPITLTAINTAPKVYYKVTDADELNADDVVIFVYETGKVAAGAMGSNPYLASIDITAALNTASDPASISITDEAVIEFTLSGEAGAWVLTSSEGKLSEKSHSAGSSCDLVKDGETTWSIAISEGNATITGTDNYIQYNTGSPRFRTYKSGQKIIQLYKKSDGTTPKPSAELAYADAQKLAKLGAAFTAQGLTNPHSVTVSYASSDEGVIKVNASTGAITEIVAAGKAVITASFAGNDDYKAGSASYTIFVAEQAGTNEDPLTEASAKALIDLGCTLTVHVNGLVLSQNATNFTVTLTNGFQFFKAKDLNNVAFESAYLGAGDEVTAVGALKKYNTTYELDEGCYLTFYEQATTPLTPIANTKETAYTVAQALAFAAAPTTYDLADHVYIQGVVYSVKNFNSTNGTYDIYIKDAGTSEDDGKFEFYKCAGLYDADLDAVVPFEEGDVQEGDEVIGYGVMTYYSGGSIWEFGQPNQLVSLNRPTIAVTGVELNKESTSLEVGDTETLVTTVAPANATNKAVTWASDDETVATVDENGVVTAVAEGTTTITVTTVDGSFTDDCEVTVTAADPTVHHVTFIAGTDKSDETSITKDGITISATTFNNDSYYQCYSGEAMTVSSTVGNITKIELTCTASGTAKYGPGNWDFTGYSYDGTNGSWAGSAETVEFGNASQQVRMTLITVTYKEDNRAAAGLAWSTDAVELTVGDEFTAPTLSNPNNISASAITIESSNTDLAVVNDGVVSLVSEATGEATITATFAGNETYKPAEVSYTITVNAAAMTDYYQKATSVVEGTYLIVYEESSVAFDGGLTALDAVENTIDVTIVGGNKIAVSEATTAATFYLDPTAGTVQAKSGKYIGVSSNSNGLKTSDDASAYTHAFSIDESGNAVIAPAFEGSTMSLRYNTANNQLRFRYYKDNGQQSIALYKLANEVIKPEAGLAWDPAEDITLTVGDAFTAPTLLNPNSIDAAEITIESSNTDVATVTAGVVELVENATGTTTITATFAGNASYKPATVSYKIKVNPANSIYVSPSLNVNFGSVAKDATVENKVITVTLTGVANATATLAGDGASAFEFTPEALTASGDITISANTATAGEFEATLTISDDAGLAASKVVNLSLKVTEPEIIDDLSGTWVLATAVPEIGEKFIVAGTYNSVTKTMGSQNTNPNRAAVESSLTEGVLTPGEGTKVFTLINAGSGKFAIRASNGKYLSASGTGTQNYLTEAANYEADNAKWTISIDGDGFASVVASSNNRNVMQYNKSGDGLFSCYSGNQTKIQLFVLQSETPEPTYTEVRNGLTVGWYYTMCLDKAVTAVKAGSIWKVLSKAANSSDVILEEAELPLVAGRPYIFRAAASTLEVAYTGDAVLAPVNDAANNGLVGSFTEELLDQNSNHYIIHENALYYVNSDNVYVGAHRAYLDMTGVPAYSNEPQQGAPRRRVTMAVYGKDEAQGFDNLESGDAPKKVMIDGTLYIFRGEKQYDATGRLVK